MSKKLRFTLKQKNILAIIAACLVAFVIVFLWYPPELFYAPMQNFDTPAHLYSVEKLLSSGLSEMLHLSPSGGFYPPLFHIIAAGFAQIFGLFGGVSAAWIFGAGIVFPVGVYFLTQETLVSIKSRYKNYVLLLAPILAVSFLAFPYSLLDVGTLYAYGFAISLLPWLLFFAKRFWRVLSLKSSKKDFIVASSGVIISFILITLAQPRALFLAAPIILVDVIYFIVKQWRTKRKLAIGTLAISSGALAVFIAGIGFYVVKSLRSDLLWHPENWFESVTPTHSWLEAILVWLGGVPKLMGVSLVSIIVIIIIITTLIFAIRKWKDEIVQKFLILYGFFGLIYVFCVSSNSGFAKFISAPWYQNGWRILAVLPILVIPVFALFMIKLFDKIPVRGKILVTFLVPAVIISCAATIILGVGSLQLKTQVVNQAKISDTSLFSKSELELSQSVKLEPNSLILADPTTGANYIRFFTDYELIFSVINPESALQEALTGITDAFRTNNVEKLKKLICVSGRPVYFIDFGAQSNIFGGEQVLKPWQNFHDQTTIKALEQNGIFREIIFVGEYGLYRIECE